ncbi:MAG: YcxB family protein [Bacilli bacterium]
MKKINVKTSYTRENYLIFNRVHYHFLLGKKAFFFLLFIILTIPLILLTMFSSIGRSYPIAFFFILLDIFIILELFTNLLPDIEVKRVLKNNKEIENLLNSYTFYNDHFTVKNEMLKDSLLYKELYQVIETSSFLYLYINKNSAYLVNKKDIKESDKEELISILREIIGKKHYFRR